MWHTLPWQLPLYAHTRIICHNICEKLEVYVILRKGMVLELLVYAYAYQI